MPEPQHYEVTAPNGRKFDIQGDSPPTEADLDEIFAHIDDGTKAPAPESPSMLSLAGTAAGTFVKDLTVAPFQQAWDVASNAFQRSRNVQGAMQSGDIGTAALEAARANPLVHMVVEPALAMGKRAVEDVRQGRYSEGIGRGVAAAAAVPSLGLSLAPAAIGEQIGSGDPRQQAEAVGHIGAAVLGPKVVPKALEGIARIPASVVKAIPHDSPELAPALMAKAMKMSPKEPAVLERVKSALDDVNEIQRQTGQKIDSAGALYDVLIEAKRQNRAQFDQLRDPQAAMGAEVDLTPVAEAIERSIPERVKLKEPKKAAEIRAQADTYRRAFPVLQVEQFLQEGNASLQSYYGKNPAARRASAAANPDIADTVAEVGELRTQLYKTLDRPAGGQAARDLQRRFGALAQLTENAQKAIPRADISEVTDTLASTLGKFEMARELGGAAVKGVGGLATGNVPMMLGAGVDAARGVGALKFAQWMKWRNSPEGLLVRALNAHTGLPTPVQMPPPVQIRGQLPAPAIQLGPSPEPPEPPMAVRGEYGAKWTPPAQPAAAVIAPEPVPVTAKPVTPSAPPTAKLPTPEEYESTLAKFTGGEAASPKAHFTSLFGDAKAHGYTGTYTQLKDIYDAAYRDAKAIAAEGEQHGPTALLEAIAAEGGIGADRVNPGEVAWLREHSKGFIPGKMTKAGRFGASRHMPSGELGGVPGVFHSISRPRRDVMLPTGPKTVKAQGLNLDEMVEALNQDPRFKHIEGPNDLIDEMTKAIHAIEAGHSGSQNPIKIMEGLFNIKRGQQWWEATEFDPEKLKD